MVVGTGSVTRRRSRAWALSCSKGEVAAEIRRKPRTRFVVMGDLLRLHRCEVSVPCWPSASQPRLMDAEFPAQPSGEDGGLAWHQSSTSSWHSRDQDGAVDCGSRRARRCPLMKSGEVLRFILRCFCGPMWTRHARRAGNGLCDSHRRLQGVPHERWGQGPSVQAGPWQTTCARECVRLRRDCMTTAARLPSLNGVLCWARWAANNDVSWTGVIHRVCSLVRLG